MKTNKRPLANSEVVSNTRMPNHKILGGVARIFTIAAAVVALPAHPVQASNPFNDNQNRVLPFPTQTVSTIPSNDDVNPYGVAFVPEIYRPAEN